MSIVSENKTYAIIIFILKSGPDEGKNATASGIKSSSKKNSAKKLKLIRKARLDNDRKRDKYRHVIILFSKKQSNLKLFHQLRKNDCYVCQ